jgi:hypothetical protein
LERQAVKAGMAALLRMASPKNHTQPGSHPISSTFDVPQHLPSFELPKLLKHCLSSCIKARAVPSNTDPADQTLKSLICKTFIRKHFLSPAGTR